MSGNSETSSATRPREDLAAPTEQTKAWVKRSWKTQQVGSCFSGSGGE